MLAIKVAWMDYFSIAYHKCGEQALWLYKKVLIRDVVNCLTVFIDYCFTVLWFASLE